VSGERVEVELGVGNGSGDLAPDARALVRLSAAVASGADADLDPVLGEAREACEPRQVEEALIQSYLFLGYPAALNALAAWRGVVGEPGPEAAPMDAQAWVEAGEVTCRAVYGSAYEGLRENIGSISPDMDVWMVTEGYGKVLSRPGLALPVRECCVVAILTVLGTARQLRSHVRGALLTGASPDAVRGSVEEALRWAPDRYHARAREVLDQVISRWESR
jgi:4-carboxymuconolactone decarboxylase